MTLTPIERATTSTRCADALRDQILQGELAAGARLPPERDLAVTLGVNRVTVRAALQTLAAEKLVRIRQGSGAFVEDFKARGGPDLLSSWIRLARGPEARAALEDLLAIRRALASEVIKKVAARIAAERAHGKRTTLDALMDAVDVFAAAVARDPSPAHVAAADLEVTRAIVAASKSAVMQMCLNPIAAVLERLPMLRAAMYAQPDTNVDGYRALVSLLDAAHGPDDAAAATLAVLAASDALTLDTLDHTKKGRSTP